MRPWRSKLADCARQQVDPKKQPKSKISSFETLEDTERMYNINAHKKKVYQGSVYVRSRRNPTENRQKIKKLSNAGRTSRANARALALGSEKCARKQILHRKIVEQDPTKHGKMPDIMASPNIVEEPGTPAFRDLGRIDQCAHHVHHDRFDDREVEV